MVHIVGIAGGSGCGKSTLAYNLQNISPKLIEVIHFDDYQKKRDFLPKLCGMHNWDSPESVDFDRLIEDIKTLVSGKEVRIKTRNEKYSPNYLTTGEKNYYSMKPKPILIVEGYLSLANSELRELYDTSVYLDLSFEESLKRRTKFINPEYRDKVLEPMFRKHVVPTRKLADLIVDTQSNSQDEVKDIVELYLKGRNIL